MRPEEVAELNAEFDVVLENAPTEKGSSLDKQGRSVRQPGCYNMQRSISGGGEAPGAAGMIEVAQVYHPLMLMDSALRLYGHPDLLKVAEAINGRDFTPFSEVIFHKA